MAEAQHQQVSAFPLPPMEFISQYTPENVNSGRAPKPPMPPKGKYFMFGEEFENNDVIIRSLESQGIRRLYPLHFDHKRELKKLNHSILTSYLDLLDILVKCPSGSNSKSPSPGTDAPTLRKDKLDDLNLLFIHIHHLINEYRPHQARETLRVILEKQKKERLEIADRLEHYLDRVMFMLKTNVETLGSDSPMSWNGAEDAEQKHTVAESAQPAPDEDELADAVLLKLIEDQDE